MTPDEIEALFTGDDGQFAFARWGRPIAPVVFGVQEETLAVIKGAFEAVSALTGHPLAETDPELGSNCMVFFLREWSELLSVPDLDGLLPGLGPLVDRLTASRASRYRAFRFDARGAIRAAFVFLRMDGAMSSQPAQTLALGEVVQVMLLWSQGAFRERSPLAAVGETVILRPDIAGLVCAAYDPGLPAAAEDRSLALRLFARMQRPKDET
ncbi:MAG: hypothetical protein ACK5MY_12745 [Jhaorihella sp.]